MVIPEYDTLTESMYGKNTVCIDNITDNKSEDTTYHICTFSFKIMEDNYKRWMKAMKQKRCKCGRFIKSENIRCQDCQNTYVRLANIGVITE